jgi:hypothetical protein
MTGLPPELAAFASLLDAPLFPGPRGGANLPMRLMPKGAEVVRATREFKIVPPNDLFCYTADGIAKRFRTKGLSHGRV